MTIDPTPIDWILDWTALDLAGVGWPRPHPTRPPVSFSQAQASRIDSVGTGQWLLVPPILHLELIRRPDSEPRQVLSVSPTEHRRSHRAFGLPIVTGYLLTCGQTWLQLPHSRTWTNLHMGHCALSVSDPLEAIVCPAETVSGTIVQNRTRGVLTISTISRVLSAHGFSFQL